MKTELEIVITQITFESNLEGERRIEYRYTDLEEAEMAFNNLQSGDCEFKSTSIRLVEVANRG